MKKIIFIQLVQKMKPKFIVLAVDSLIVCWYNWIKWDKTGKNGKANNGYQAISSNYR